MNASRLLRQAVCAALLPLGLQAQAGDLNEQMSRMFNDIGAMANVTGPGAFRSQAMNVYTGGELQMRAPVSNYQLWTATLPSVNAGCGGIDAYLGSFSHINSEQFKAMMQQIGANTVGILFKMALASLTPMIEQKISELGLNIDMKNFNSINTCQMAESLVGGVWGSLSNSANKSCIVQAINQYGMDYAAAERRCQNDIGGVNADTKASGDASTRALAERDMNLVWEALRGSSFTADEKTVFMNLAGTVLIYKAANAQDAAPAAPTLLPPSVDSLTTLLIGNGTAPSPTTVSIDGWLVCNDDDCMAPQRTLSEITPFTSHVRTMLLSLRDKMRNRTQPDAAEISFINMTSVPVYRMLALGYLSDSADRGTYMTDMLIERYAKLIAYDYAHVFLSRALMNVRGFVGAAGGRGQIERDEVKAMQDRLDRILVAISQELEAALQRVPNLNAVMDDLQRIERQLRVAMPASMRHMVEFGALMSSGRASRN